ncbi:uncharacterized protein PGTG_15806 [Puccinia graminis f. sp. tritici CRL 75-36-700-3]|uniref:Uncharacterized protein n=1 Tax=Puccinia graminis f. sp. tritici (strain CRL 75-36-700-3 / race SCCL) TaxID=418459 RepID=E3KZW9_PUCGT|nr:uncharacterized protein PGTG_15806 [Puccinia graminis f. sp. tritici CRL 75-36-700-3]EFP89850.2 hypothetical protein PGTG_15806 [Puccinia graminis f. sp. tritici CRL 75-36-700-3]
MFSSNSTLSFSSTELNSSHLNHYSRAPFRPRNHPKSRSKLHHHHQHQHDHHPSWSSSLSAFSLQQQQRASGFLIDEYGNEHDPERKPWTQPSVNLVATRAAPHPPAPPRMPVCVPGAAAAAPPPPAEPPPPTPPSPHPPEPPSRTRPAAVPTGPARALKRSPTSSSTPPTTPSRLRPPPPHPPASPAGHPSNPGPRSFSSSSPTTTASSSRGSRSSWTRTLWAHLRLSSSSSPAPPSPPVSYALHQAAHPIFSLPTHPAPAKPPAHLPFLTRFHLSPASEHPHHLSAVRKRLELVKLEVRFGILRTRKRVVGAWKQQTGCKKL